MSSLRNHGLPPCGDPIEAPTWTRADVPFSCPNCGSAVAEVKVLVKLDLLNGGVGEASYFGCPACPWASPAMAVSLGDAEQA